MARHDEIITNYITAYKRLYGAKRASHVRLSYRKGWFTLVLASIKHKRRGKELNEMAERLNSRPRLNH